MPSPVEAWTKTAADERAAFEAANLIFQARCKTCHGGHEPEMGLYLERDKIYRATVNAPARSAPNDRIVVPGDPDRSLLYRKLLPPEQGHYSGPRMPQRGKPLSDADIAIVRAWIASFATDTWGPPPGVVAAAGGGAQPAVPPEAPRAQPIFHDRFLAHLPGPDTLGGGGLEFRFAHTFRGGARDSGLGNLYGFDSGAWVSLGLGYGITDRFDVGVRRTGLLQDYEAWGKGTLVQQSEGGWPIAVGLYGSYAHLDGSGVENRDRWSGQLILARCFAPWLSLALVPTYVWHTNYLDSDDTRGTKAVGAAAELRVTRSMAITGEWIGQVGGVENLYQGGTLGLSFRTRNHAFAFFMTNLQSFHTDLYAPGGDLDIASYDFRLGFNISRRWQLRRD